ncbi:hypothetical protein H9P43_002538 [Blastocladiella emersonii ATCC 22665]|nr:hypothetical protein H9P43_002538 [Blastocladiella emersonii ATCC 22665]
MDPATKQPDAKPVRGPTPPADPSLEPPLATDLPHEDLELSSMESLKHCARVQCETCRDRVRYYCPTCLIPRGTLTPPVMPVLPFVFDVWKHNLELKGKSTALHAKVLCPEDTRVFEYPSEVAAYENPAERTLVLYPSSTATPIGEIDPTSFTHVIVIDGTWYQAHQMVRDAPFLKNRNVRHVTFAAPPKTKFWRFQQKSEQHLATIEAMWWLVREYLAAHRPTDNQHAFDDLLWFYTFQYQRILGEYQEKKDRKFTTRMKGQFGKDLERVRGADDGESEERAAEPVASSAVSEAAADGEKERDRPVPVARADK